MSTRGTMFCHRCGYALDGLAQNRCPECGRPFYPELPNTYRSTPRPRILPTPRTGLALLLAAMPIIISIAGGYIFSVRLGFKYFPGSNIAPVPFLITIWPMLIAAGVLLAWLIYRVVRR